MPCGQVILHHDLAMCNPIAYFKLVDHCCRLSLERIESSDVIDTDSGSRGRGSSSSEPQSSAEATNGSRGGTACGADSIGSNESQIPDQGLLSGSTLGDLRYLGLMLQLPDLFCNTEWRQQLLSNWQQQKAYTSAYASWVKAWIKMLQQHGLREAGLDGTGNMETRPVTYLLQELAINAEIVWNFMGINRLVCGNARCRGSLPTLEEQAHALEACKVRIDEEEQKGALLGIQLVQLQWLARAVAAAGRVLHQAAGSEGGGRSMKGSSSSSSERGNNSSTGELKGSGSSSNGTSSKQGDCSACPQEDSTATTPVFGDKVLDRPGFYWLMKVALLQRKCLLDWHRYAGGGDLITTHGSGEGEHAGGGGGGEAGRARAAGQGLAAAPAAGGGEEAGRALIATTAAAQGAAAGVGQAGGATLAVAAAGARTAAQGFFLATGAEGSPPATAETTERAGPVSAGMVGVAALEAGAAAGREAVVRPLEPRASAGVGAGRPVPAVGTAGVGLPRRLALLPQARLPAAVVDQLEHINKSWSPQDMSYLKQQAP